MKSIKFQSHVGPDGVLKLEIPVGFADADLEVLVVVQASPSTPAARRPEALGWPAGYFEQTFGCLQADRLAREVQGEYEARDELM